MFKIGSERHFATLQMEIKKMLEKILINNQARGRHAIKAGNGSPLIKQRSGQKIAGSNLTHSV